MALAFAVALIAAASAHAAYYKMVACAANSGAPPYTTNTNTASPQNPGGIFELHNWCGGAGADPPGDAAYMRIVENQPSGLAGTGAYANFVFDTPGFVHFKAAGGYTRQPNAFNEGWRARFWLASATATQQIMIQGLGLPNAGGQWAITNVFAPHLWPIAGYWDFNRFVYEMQCVRPSGCDRVNYNATDLNGLLFILSDDSNSQAAFTGGQILSGAWVRGTQNVNFNVSDLGSGLRVERMRVDGDQRWIWDHWPECSGNISTSPLNGEWARTYVPCPTGGPYGRTVALDTATFGGDGAHELQICTQDYAQYQGLENTGSESCDKRWVHTDNSAPGAPPGLTVTSANPNRYLDHFGVQFSLPPNQGSPVTKVHYNVVDAAGNVVVPEKVVAGTNPTSLAGIEGPAQAGDYRLRVWLEDAVGFSGPALTAPIPHDTTPPAAPQGLAVTAPTTSRAADGFDLRWRNLPDAGSPIDSARYQVLDGSGKVAVPTTSASGDNVQAIANLDPPGPAGNYQLRLWLTDAEGNVGAPVTAPLAYDCMRSPVAGGTQLSAALAGQPSQTVQQGQGASLAGSLSGQSGAVATAPVCIYSRVATDAGKEFLGIALTNPAGSYRFPIPAGPSRELSAIYRPGQRQLRASADLRTVVHPTLRTPSRVVKNKGIAHFEGEIPGPHNDQVVIVLQVKSGKGWLAFRRYRTRNDGHYNLEYHFRRTTKPTSYEMRAQVRETTGYPYEQGDSDPLALRVVPGHAKHRGGKPHKARRRCAKGRHQVKRRGKRRCAKPKHRGKAKAASGRSPGA